MIRDSAYEKLILRFEYADGVLGRTSSGWECSECGLLHWLDDSVWRLVGRGRLLFGERTLIGLSPI